MLSCIFFFQAEDGIRDLTVTGVQTCALPICKGCALQGLAIDAQGLLPQALADALEGIPAAEGKVVYLTPTLHNPTTATMGAERRQAIVDICRSAGAWIIEDGVYAACLPDHASLAHLATLAPEITLHVNGLSKSLGPGLQVGMLVLPASLGGAAVELVQEMSMAPSALSCAVIDEWLSHGVVASLQADLRHEAQRRCRLAASHLASHLSGSGLVLHPEAYNAWLPMEREADRKSTRLNSSHSQISYAVFCLKKKKRTH